MLSWLMLSAVYCDQMDKVPFAEHYNRLTIQLLLSFG